MNGYMNPANPLSPANPAGALWNPANPNYYVYGPGASANTEAPSEMDSSDGAVGVFFLIVFAAIIVFCAIMAIYASRY